MVQRKQDALSTNFLLGLLEDEKKVELQVDVRKAPRVRNDESLSHLSNRIQDEIRVTTPQQRAQHVLERAGIDSQHIQPSHTVNRHLQHVGQVSRKIPITTPERKIRRVKKQPTTPLRRRSLRGPPPATRTRPAVGMDDEVRRSARDASNAKGKRNNRRRKLRR